MDEIYVCTENIKVVFVSVANFEKGLSSLKVLVGKFGAVLSS